MTTEVSSEYIRAAKLNRRIITAAQLAQQSLYDMCMGFKEMRDSKLYKELGYTDFGDYCEQETGFKRSQAYNYISIVEKLPAEFVHSSGQIGVKKLTLLATISEEEREQITAENNLESATVKELEQQIKQLRADKDKAVAEKSAAEADLALKTDAIASLERQVSELESRPAETVVEKQEVIPEGYVSPEEHQRALDEEEKRSKKLSDEIMRLKSTQNAERSGKLTDRIAELEQQLADRQRETTKAYGKASRASYDSETKGRALEEAQQKNAELEKRIEELKNTPPEKVEVPADNADVFNAYLKSAYDALNRLVEFVKTQNSEAFTEKTVRLIDSVKSSIGD